MKFAACGSLTILQSVKLNTQHIWYNTLEVTEQQVTEQQVEVTEQQTKIR